MARSPREILYRLKQEAANLYLYASPPRLPSGFKPAPLALPDPASVAAHLRNSSFAAELEHHARAILDHRFPVLGLTIETGPEIEWRKDYVHGTVTAPLYFRRIPYLDLAKVGDHKVIWELSRHQHLVLLAQAWLINGRQEFADEIMRQLESWLEQNPFQCGIHWASALEVGFRALSWIWIWHFAGPAMPGALRQSFLTALYRHGLHLRHNLSVYFSPNTHLLGEAVALHALGILFPALPHAAEWRAMGRTLVLAQLDSQVQEDGSHFEHSSYYHVYALDMFLFHHILEPVPDTGKLERMACYLDALMGQARTLTSMGDDDGGRLFHPYGPRGEFGRATLATCAALFPDAGYYWQPEDLPAQAASWLGERVFTRPAPTAQPVRKSRLFTQSGVAVMVHQDAQILVDAGPFGNGGAGHSHSDCLSLTARLSNDPVLIDPGTFTYVGDPKWRDWFRGSSAHNTICVDGANQAVAVGPFRWKDQPSIQITEWNSNPDFDYLDATCRTWYRHRRRVLFLKSGLVLVLDEVDELPGEHMVEQFWHLGNPGMRDRLVFPSDRNVHEFTEGGEHGWQSPVFGLRLAAPVIRVTRTTALPVAFTTAIDLQTPPRQATLALIPDTSGGWSIEWIGAKKIAARFPAERGLPMFI